MLLRSLPRNSVIKFSFNVPWSNQALQLKIKLLGAAQLHIVKSNRNFAASKRQYFTMKYRVAEKLQFPGAKCKICGKLPQNGSCFVQVSGVFFHQHTVILNVI